MLHAPFVRQPWIFCLSGSLSIYLSISRSISLSVNLFIYLFVCWLYICLPDYCVPICLSTHPSTSLSAHFSTCLSVSLLVSRSVCLTTYLSLYPTVRLPNVSLSACSSLYHFVYLHVYVSLYMMFTFLPVNLCPLLSIWQSVFFSTRLSTDCLARYPSVCLYFCLCTHMAVCKTIYPSLYHFSVSLSLYLSPIRTANLDLS